VACIEPSSVGEVRAHGVGEVQDIARDAAASPGDLAKSVHDSWGSRERICRRQRLGDPPLLVASEERGRNLEQNLVDAVRDRVDDHPDR